MEFSEKDCWFVVKFHLDTDVKDIKAVKESIQKFRLWQLLERYAAIYNANPKNEKKVKLKLESSEVDRTIMIGI